MIYIKNGDAWVETADADIPPAILAALKADGTHKNLKIHFPNGEIPDFDNSFIVRESLRFTESICSQDTFKFGLAEASVLEFETVGVGNMRGMTIEANLFYGPDADPVAYVPLGVFTVESCPRDGSVLMRRKITAFSLGGGGSITNSPIENLKLAQPTTNPGGLVYTPDLERLIQAAIGWHSPGYLAQYPKTQMSVTPARTQTNKQTYTTSIPMTNGNTMMISVRADWDEFSLRYPDFSNEDLFSLERDDALPAQTALADIAAAALRAETGATETEIAQIVQEIVRATSCTFYNNGYRFTGGLPAIYTKSPGNYPLVSVVTGARLEIRRGLSVQRHTADIPTAYAFYRIDAPTSGLTATFQPTASYLRQPGNVNTSTFIDCYNLTDICSGYYEVAGKFLRHTREGGIEVYDIRTEEATPVLPGETMSVWYDEAELAGIGTVLVTVPTEDGDEIRDITIGTGNAVYDMTSNAFFAAVDGATYDSISAMIQNQFAPAVNGILLRRVELDMIGLPHIQAGTPLAVQTEDGETVSLFALRRDLSGIQRLTDSITSPSFEGGVT